MARPSLVDQISAAIETRPALRSLALTGLFVMAAVGALKLASEVFVPLTLALMGSFVFRPLVRRLQAVGIPPIVGATAILVVLVGGVGYGVERLVEPVATWAEKLPHALRVAEVRVRPLRRPVDKVSKIAAGVERLTAVEAQQSGPEVRVQEPSLAGIALTKVLRGLGGGIVSIMAFYFMLVWGDGLLERLIRLVSDIREQQAAQDVIRQIERRMSQYLGTIVCINVALGAAVGLAVNWLGMPNPVLWGCVAAGLNFVPYLGSIVGVAILSMAAIVSYSDLAQAAGPPLVYFCLTVLEGQVVTPIVLGRAFQVSPLIIFIWLVFWAWLWGVIGTLIAVPLLMLIKITCEQSSELRPVAEFLQR